MFKLLIFISFVHFSWEQPTGQKYLFQPETEPPVIVEDSASMSHLVEIDRIFIIGNKKTKEKIILREMDVEEGEMIVKSELEEMLEKDKNKIMNTSLFLNVNYNIIELSPQKVDIIIRVAERWYLFPFPIFELADRNFNEWWVNQNRDLSRVEYGLKLYKYNMRGSNETLRLLAQFGFTKKFQMSYTVPYIDQAQKIGLRTYGEYSENDNFNYITVGNKQQDLDFLDSDVWQLRKMRFGIDGTYRRSFYNFHRFRLEYANTRIKDTVAILNPNYLLDGRTGQKMFSLGYNFRRDLRDFAPYPLDGFLLLADVTKLGLGLFNDIDQLEISAQYTRYFDLKNNFYFASSLGGKFSFPAVQPYNNLNAFGFNPFLIRGYDLYVIEGQRMLMNRNTFKMLLFQHEQQLNQFIPLKQFQKFPIAVYLKSYFDMGYIANNGIIPENNTMVNRFLFGGGIGLDLVTFYDMVLRFEYSINRAGETGFYFGIKSDL
ncbi:MAG: POTRA domain-containing protein [Candidatus Cyclobacteriaceae bacterium M3_2C_046]